MSRPAFHYRLISATTRPCGLLKARWSFCVLLLFAAFLLPAGCGRSGTEDTAHKPSRKEHFIEQGEFVRFTLSGTDFKIPRAYAAGGAEQYGLLTSAKLHALLPDFVGYEPERNGKAFRYEFSRRPGWGRKLYVTLTERGRYAAYPFAWITWQNESAFSPLYGRDGVYDEMRYGLEYYQDNIDNSSREDYLLYRAHNGAAPLVFARCAPNVPSPSCHFDWSYNDKLNAQMDFSMKYLSQWKAIWAKVNSLFESGTTSGFDEAAWQARVTDAFGKDYYQWKATLPDFQPCRPDDCPERFKVRVEPPGYDNRLYVRVTPRSRNATPLPELWRKLYDDREDLFISVGDQYDEMRYGLEFHRGKAMRSSEAFHNDVYVRRSGGAPEVVFSCYAEANKHTKNPIPVRDGCTGQWALSSNDIMYAAFSREYLPIWQKIMAWASNRGMRTQQDTSNQRQGE